MGLDFSTVFAKIEELFVSDRSVSACMIEIVSICSRDVPHSDWSRLAALDYDGDVATLASWMPCVFERQAPAFLVQGLWFGLCNPCDDDKVWADMYVGTTSRYDPNDEELRWLWEAERHYPEDGYADSPSLRSIYEIGYGCDDGLGNDAEWPLCLAFGAFSVRTLLHGQTTRLVASTAPRIGVAVGFDSGDMLKLGELTDKGFEMRCNA